MSMKAGLFEILPHFPFNMLWSAEAGQLPVMNQADQTSLFISVTFYLEF